MNENGAGKTKKVIVLLSENLLKNKVHLPFWLSFTKLYKKS